MPNLDQLFLLNLGIDALLLRTLVRLLGSRADWRIFLGGMLGAAAATLALLPGLSVVGAAYVEIPVAIAMVYITVRPRTPRIVLQGTLLLLVLAAVLAGITLLLTALVPLRGLLPLSLAALLFLGIARIAEGWLRRARQHSGVRELEVEIAGRRGRLRCLIDSGCLAHDPMTGLPVMVAELRALSPLLPVRLRGALLQPALEAAQEVAGAAEGDGELLHRLRLVQVQTVGRGSEWLIGFRAAVGVPGEGRHSAVVLISPRRLSKRGAFEAIVPPDFWTLEEGNAS